MLLRNISELPALLKKNQCLLGLDYGSKIIGVAVSDPLLRVASPLSSIPRVKFPQDSALLIKIIRERSIGGIVVGMPKNMEGDEDTPTAQAARAFVRNVTSHPEMPHPDIPVVFWDERFSTAAVERFMIADDMSRKRRQEVIDKAAAAYILQGALDALSSNIVSKT
jgi:putative Holliday junction resolvase